MRRGGAAAAARPADPWRPTASANKWLTATVSAELAGPALLVREGLQLLDNCLLQFVSAEAAGSRGLVYLVQGAHGRVGLLPAYALLDVSTPEAAAACAAPGFDPLAPRPPLPVGARVALQRATPGQLCGPDCEEMHASGNCAQCGRTWGRHDGHDCNDGAGPRGRWGVPGLPAPLPDTEPVLGPEGTVGTVLAGGLSLLLDASQPGNYLCQLDEAFGLLARAGSTAPAPPTTLTPSLPVDAVPSRETMLARQGRGRESGLAPQPPPHDLWHSTSQLLARKAGEQPASSLGGYITLAQACLAPTPPSPQARRHGLALLKLFHALVAPLEGGEGEGSRAGGGEPPPLPPPLPPLLPPQLTPPWLLPGQCTGRSLMPSTLSSLWARPPL